MRVRARSGAHSETERLGERPGRISRRGFLVLSGLTLGGALSAAPAQEGPGLLLPVGDLARLVRKLLAARREGVRASKRMRLSDPSSGRTATMLVADDGTETLALLLTFEVVGEPLHVHTVSVTSDDGESLYLELFRAPVADRRNREIVGARLDASDLERLAAATSVTVTARGWDETFTATLDTRELEKIRRFHQARSRATAEEPVTGSRNAPPPQKTPEPPRRR
jgi:hypothetical protein